MNKFFCVVKSLLFCLVALNAVNSVSQPLMPKWMFNPYDEKLFIENNGQYASIESELKCKILYGFEQGNTTFYLCANEFIVQESKDQINNDAEDVKEDDPARRQYPESIHTYLRFSFGLINRDMDIQGGKKAAELNKYHLPDESGTKRMLTASSFGEVIFKNIYDGIDLVFNAHENYGLKYKYIVHPHANISLITLNYSGNGELHLDKSGSIHAGIPGDEIIDNAPNVYYADDSKEIKSSYSITKTSYSVNTEDYDHSRTIIVDPWVVNPNFTAQNVAFDIACDPIGNVYAFGGQNPWKLKKFTAGGNPIWTYNTTYSSWYGDFAVDIYGNCFITEGCCGGGIMKLDSAANVHWDVNIGVYELWRLAFNCDDSRLYLANGYSSGNPLAESINLLDTSNGNITNSTIAFNTAQEEPRALSVAPNGDVYILSCNASDIWAMNPGFTQLFAVPSGYSLLYNGPLYANGGNTTSGQNGISAGNNFFCTSNGATLYKRNLLSGASLGSIAIPGGSAENNSGVYVDFCGNIFVGSSNEVIKYDSSLNQLATYATTGAVYDIFPGLGGDLLVCGNGFIADIAAAVCPPTFNPTAAFSASPLNGCAPLTVTFTNTSTGANSYHWNFGDGNTDTVLNPTHTYTTAGSDTVTLIVYGSGGCGGNGTDTVQQIINIVTAPTVNLGNDTSICPGQNVTFNAGNPGATYQWSTGANTQTITVNTAGTYWVIASYGNCSDTDSVTVTILPNLTVALGNDTTLCIGQSLTLNASNPGATYQWSTGANTQIINVTTNGTYWVNVSQGACTGTDTIIVNFVAGPVVNLGNDTTLCSGQPITLDAGNPGDTYLWSNGAFTQTIIPTTSGIYWVHVTSNGNCVATDSIHVTFTPLPVVNLGPDQALCNGNTATFDAGNPGDTYIWSTGANTQTITVSTAGTYWVRVANGTCIGTDTVNVITSLSASVNLGPDIKLCNGASIILNAGNPGMNYLWSNGETTQTINVTTSGTYYINVSSNGCTGSDTVNVVIEPPLTVSLGPDTTICPGDQLVIDAGKGYAAYSWIPGGESSHLLIITQPGTYGLTVLDSNGCIALTSIWIADFCPSDLYVPSAFSPTGNGINDLFFAYCENVAEFHMYIFNRWGQQIFDSEDISQGWDGNYNGEPVPQGTYVYRIDYKLYNYAELQKHTKVGTVTLIR